MKGGATSQILVRVNQARQPNYSGDLRMALIRRYNLGRAFASRTVPFAGRAWRTAGNLFFRYHQLEPKATCPQTLLLFSDEKHLDLLVENLWTLANTWEALPRLCIVGDLKASEHTFRKVLDWWPQPWDFIPYEQIETTFINERRDWLAKFGRHHIFGRKLAAILYSARKAPTLYSDSDVLWLGAPRFLEVADPQAPFLLVSRGPYPSYCDEMIDSASQDLMQPPYACAGLLYLFQWPWPESVLEEWVNRALAVPPHAFAEQTIFGLLARRYGGYIPDDEIGSFFDDWFFFLPTRRHPDWSARHYFGPVRHHFYRDAFLMRWRFLRRPSLIEKSKL